MEILDVLKDENIKKKIFKYIPIIEKPEISKKTIPKEIKDLDLNKITKDYLQDEDKMPPKWIVDKIKKWKPSDAEYNILLSLNGYQTHADIISNNKIYLIVTSTTLIRDWKNYISIIFLKSILGEFTHIVIWGVLQEVLVEYDLEKWDSTDLKKLVFNSSKSDLSEMERHIIRNSLYQNYKIGHHTSKMPKLSDTIEKMSKNPNIPYQIFLSMKSSFVISDEEISKSLNLVQKFNLRVYVHSPYILNLASENKYVVESLKYHLQVSKSAGFKGVVVHSGKYVDRDPEDALKNMRENILKILDDSSSECPLLLETPAGQKSELLTKSSDLINFIKDLDSDKIGICLDTCHVFSTGYLPSKYLNEVLENAEDKIKLIHFNDSMTVCNSHVDRHAGLCSGTIPPEDLMNVAFIAQNYGIDLVTE